MDIPAATKKGVVVMNTPGGNTVTTAEHTIGMLFACARMIPQAYASMKAGKWEKKKFEGVELWDKTLGVVGLGAIGGVVASRCAALGMKVLAYDPFISTEKAKALGVELADLPTIWKRADFITVHTPKTKETANLINTATIAQMKDGVRIINCARGGIVNEQDLYEALKSGKVGAAAFDVFEKEPPENHPLLTLDNFIATPHLGASTQEAQENVATAVAEQVVDYLVAGTVRNAVNVPSVPADQLPTLSPYINLAERMGLFQAQLCEGGLTEVLRGVQRRGRGAQARAGHAGGAQGAADADPRGERQLRQRAADRQGPGHRGQGLDLLGRQRVHEPDDHQGQGRREGALRRGDPQQQEGAADRPGRQLPDGGRPRGRHARADEQRQARRHRRDRHADGRERHQHRPDAVRPRDAPAAARCPS